MILLYGEIRYRRIHKVTQELLGKARKLAQDTDDPRVGVVLLTDHLEEDPQDLCAFGADLVYLVEHPRCARFNQEIAAKILGTLVEELAPEIVLAPATTQGRSVLPAVAVMVKTGLTADCTELLRDTETGDLLQIRPAIGGNVLATIQTPHHRPQMATVRPKTFGIPEKIPRKGRVVHPAFSPECFESAIVPESFDFFQKKGSHIQDSDVVIAGGKGLRSSEGFDLLRELADLLEGSVGASRQAVESGWIEHAHQVGLSGKVVAPKLYLGAGISGAVQHTAGMQTAEYVVGINKDPETPLFRVADLAICGDLHTILPELIARIRKERDQ